MCRYRYKRQEKARVELTAEFPALVDIGVIRDNLVRMAEEYVYVKNYALSYMISNNLQI